jgi:N-methylhydantoinase A/oxoprolinase/acetone carboxylase beta subunit
MIRVATDVGGTFTDLVYFEIDEKTKKAKKFLMQNLIPHHQIMKKEYLKQLKNLEYQFLKLFFLLMEQQS